ncbi:MAG TPA: DNA-3-methyladenine glycosylase I [Candidatus Dormibacteraeota bacterium]|nr:DNA-3-methyladenine glycosylase I [Candidatus Dormibacteraeota bacterium]
MPPRSRCAWATTPEMIEYHDREWGKPLHDDMRLFEFLVLEGAQAGLSWLTILRKREGYRALFAGFDPARVARFTPARITRLLEDPRIVRNRAKVEAAVKNARAYVKIQREFGSFDAYVWRFVGGKPVHGKRRSAADVPASSAQAEAMSKDLRARGFTFVGPTICYAFMQAVGMVNDHVAACAAATPGRRKDYM